MNRALARAFVVIFVIHANVVAATGSAAADKASAPAATVQPTPPPAALAHESGSGKSTVIEEKASSQIPNVWSPLGFWVAAMAAIVAFLSLINGRRQTLRDGMFKCFEAYLKVMDYRSKAIEIEGRADKRDEYQKHYDYYRALFDLQWTEYYLWRSRTLRDKPYMQWLIQRRRQYLVPAQERMNGTAPVAISYRLVWEDLRGGDYYDKDDPFVAHLDAVHGETPLRDVLRERKWWQGWL